MSCDASVSYKWGDHKLERGCKNKAKFKIHAKMKHNGCMFTRHVCTLHKNEIERKQKYDGYSAEIISIESI